MRLCPHRHWVILLGPSPPSLSFSACKSSLRTRLAMIDFPHVDLCLQNRDMGPKYGRVTNCGWHMVGWPRVEHKAYVAHPYLFASSSHFSYLCLRRIDNCEALHMDFILKTQPDGHANDTSSMGGTAPSRIPAYFCIRTGASPMLSAFSWSMRCSS